MRKVSLAMIALMLTLLMCSCGKNDNVLLIDWIDFVQWNGISYSVSDEQVPLSEIGVRLGEVTGNPPCEVTGETGYSTQDGEAAFLPVGTDIFSLRSFPEDECVAVLLDGKYILYKRDRGLEVNFTLPSETDTSCTGSSAVKESETSVPFASSASHISDDAETDVRTTAHSGNLKFTAKSVRTDSDWSVYCNDLPDILLIKSRPELDKYLGEMDTFLYSDSSERLRDELKSCDEAFFREKCLALARFYESSGSIGHEVNRVSSENGNATVYIEKITPEIGTCDMAGWHVVITLPADSFTALSLNVDGKNIFSAESRTLRADEK